MDIKRILSFALIGTLLAAAVPAWASPPAATNSDVTAYVTAQRFDGGTMVYRADTGLIWVIFDDGSVYDFPSFSYGALPDNPFFNVPIYHVRPINGFGRIWGYHSWVRTRLGWAVGQEYGYSTRFITQNQTIYMFEFYDKIIEISDLHTWRYVSSVPNLPPDVPARVNALNVWPDPVQAGGTITVAWEVQGTDMALVEVYNSAGEAIALFDHLPLAGEVTVTVPVTEAATLRIAVWAANLPDFYVPVTMYEHVALAEVVISVTPYAPEIAYTQAAYQLYEHGFMIWRADTGAVMAFIGTQGGYMNHFPEDGYSGFPDNPYTNPPAGLVAPHSGFGKVWGNYEYVRDQLGWALGPEQPYDMTITSYGIEAAYLLPDGREAYVTWHNYWSVR